MEGLSEIKGRIRQILEKLGWDPEERVLLEEGVQVVENLEKSGSFHSPSFRLGVIVGKLGEKMKGKGGQDG